MGHLGCVLVVDDNDDVCTLLCSVLEEQGYAVHSAVSLEAARRQAAERVFDLALIDLLLTDGVGTDLVEGLCRRGTAIVLMTGAIDHEDEFGAAPWPHLRKPFRLGALLHAIDLALGRRTIIRHAGDQAQV